MKRQGKFDIISDYSYVFSSVLTLFISQQF